MVRIIIPAYNEEKNIKNCLLKIYRSLTKNKIKFIIYLVNDGSKDRTLQIIESLRDRDNLPLVVINHKQNRGVAQAFKTGFNHLAKICNDNDLIILMEGDGTSDPKLLPKIISNLQKGGDIIICSRYEKYGKYKNFPLKRLFLSKSVNLILRIIFPIKNVKDYTIFYRGYKGWIIKKLIRKHKQKFIQTKHYVANSEILIKMSKYTQNIYEIPFVYDYGNKKNPSAMKIFKNSRAYLKLFKQAIF